MRNGRPVAIWMPAALVTTVDRLARKHEMSRGAWIRGAISKAAKMALDKRKA